MYTGNCLFDKKLFDKSSQESNGLVRLLDKTLKAQINKAVITFLEDIEVYSNDDLIYRSIVILCS